jgi:hypothetical protein
MVRAIKMMLAAVTRVSAREDFAVRTYPQRRKKKEKKKKESLFAGGRLRCQGFCDIFLYH